MAGGDAGTPGGQIRPPSEFEIDRLQPLRRPQEERDGLLAVARDHGENATQEIGLSAPGLIEFASLRGVERLERCVESARLEAHLCRGQCAL